MRKSDSLFATATGLAITILVLATGAGAAVVEQFTFNHGTQPATAEPTYTPVNGEILAGATFTLQGTQGSFVDSPAPAPGVTGQSWYNTYEGYGDGAAMSEGYLSTNGPTVTGSFTMEAMIRLNTTNGTQVIFGSSPFAGADVYQPGESGAYIADNTVQFYALVANNQNNGGLAGTAGILVPDQWYHLAFVWDATTGLESIYVNDILAASKETPYGGGLGGYLSVGPYQGLAMAPGNPVLNVNGYLDGWAISDQALTPVQFVIPEPGSVALLLLGGLALVRRR